MRGGESERGVRGVGGRGREFVGSVSELFLTYSN